MGDGDSMTWVTALYDLASREPEIDRRGVEHYMRAAEPLLALPIPLVIFADPWIAAAIAKRRESHGHGSLTDVVALAFDDLDAYGHLPAIARAREVNPLLNANPNKDTALYTALTWAKLELVTRAIARLGPRAASLAWIDIGLAEVGPLAQRGLSFRPERVQALMLKPFDHERDPDPAEFFSHLRGHLAGGYLAAPVEEWRWLARRFAGELDDLLASRLAPSEEQLLTWIAMRCPERFRFHYGDYGAALANLPTPTTGGENLLMQLRVARELADFERGGEIAGPLAAAIGRGELDAPSALLADLLDECFTALFYADGDDRSRAIAVAELYARMARDDAAFRHSYLREEVRIRSNFDHLGDRAPVLGGDVAVRRA